MNINSHITLCVAVGEEYTFDNKYVIIGIPFFTEEGQMSEFVKIMD